MRTPTLFFVLLLACSSASLAQSNIDTQNPINWVPTSTGLASDKPQITGCLSRDSSGSGFVLSSASSKELTPVTSSKDLAGQVGHTLLLTGVWKNVPSPVAGKDGAIANGKKVRTFQASKIRVVAEKCISVTATPDDGIRTSIGNGTP